MELRVAIFAVLGLSCGAKPPEPVTATTAGPAAARDDAATKRVAVRLENLCATAMRYRIARERGGEPDREIAGGASDALELALGERVFNAAGSSAQLDRDGVIWFTDDCKSIAASAVPGFDPRKVQRRVAEPFPTELVGRFRAEGVLAEPGSERPGMSWFKEYTFAADGKWMMVGYPPIDRRGTATLLQREGQRFVVRFVELDEQGKAGAPIDAELVLGEDGQQLAWGPDTYRRQ